VDFKVRSVVLAGLIGWSGIAAVLSSLPPHRGFEPARFLIVGGLLLVGPGVALAAVLQIRDALVRWVLAVGFSCAVLVLAAQASLYSGMWAPHAVAYTGDILTAALACLAWGRQWGTRGSARRDPGSDTR
jgi:hypothetical protein